MKTYLMIDAEKQLKKHNYEEQQKRDGYTFNSLKELKEMTSFFREEKETRIEAKKQGLPFIRSRGLELVASNSKEGRCDDGNYHEWDGTKKHLIEFIEEMQKNYTVEQVTIIGGYDAAEKIDDFNWGEYEPGFSEFEVVVWNNTTRGEKS